MHTARRPLPGHPPSHATATLALLQFQPAWHSRGRLRSRRFACPLSWNLGCGLDPHLSKEEGTAPSGEDNNLGAVGTNEHSPFRNQGPIAKMGCRATEETGSF